MLVSCCYRAAIVQFIWTGAAVELGGHVIDVPVKGRKGRPLRKNEKNIVHTSHVFESLNARETSRGFSWMCKSISRYQEQHLFNRSSSFVIRHSSTMILAARKLRSGASGRPQSG